MAWRNAAASNPSGSVETGRPGLNRYKFLPTRVFFQICNPGGSTARIASFILPIPASSQGLLPAEESCYVTSRHGDQTDEADQAHWTGSSG